jgi:hypothetical protein
MVINPTSHDNFFAQADSVAADALTGTYDQPKNAVNPILAGVTETLIFKQQVSIPASTDQTQPIVKTEPTASEDPATAFMKILDRLRTPSFNGASALNDFLVRLNLLNSTLRNPFESMFRPPANDPIRSAVDEIRATGAPGSRTVKVGKKKYNVSVDAFGNVTVKKKRGFWSKLGGFLKRIAPFALQALNFIPGLGTALSGVLGKITAFASKLGGIPGTIAKAAINIAGLTPTGINPGGIAGGLLSKVGLGSLLESIKAPK